MLGQNRWKYGLFVDLLFYYSESHVGLGDVEWPPDRQRVPIQATTRMVVRNDYWREWEREQGVVHQGSLDWSMEGWGMKLDRGKQKQKLHVTTNLLFECCFSLLVRHGRKEHGTSKFRGSWGRSRHWRVHGGCGDWRKSPGWFAAAFNKSLPAGTGRRSSPTTSSDRNSLNDIVVYAWFAQFIAKQ